MYEGPVGISPPVANPRLLIPLLSPWLTSLQSVSTQNKLLYIYFKAPHHTAPEGSIYMVANVPGYLVTASMGTVLRTGNLERMDSLCP